MNEASEKRRHWWARWRWGVAGVVASGVAGILAAAAVLEFGLFNVAASTAHLPQVAWFVHHVMMHSVSHRSDNIKAPATVPAEAVAAGYCEYRVHCQMCHGGPGTARDEWANGLNPPPPYLVDARARWRSNQLYWIVSNGVKMTAMPAWNASLKDRQIWALVAFLENMPKMRPGTYQTWNKSSSCPSAAQVIAALNEHGIPDGLPQDAAAAR